MMKTSIFGLVAAAFFNGSVESEKIWPDLRHRQNDIYLATPIFEDFEEFLSDLDYSSDPEEVAEELVQWQNELKTLEKINLSQESSGSGFNITKRMLDLALRISVHLKKQAERKIYLDEEKLITHQSDPRIALLKLPEIESHTLKSVGIARNLVNNFTFEPDFSQYLLIRLLGRSNNSNIQLFYDQFRKRFPKSQFSEHVQMSLALYLFKQKNYDKSEAILKELSGSKATLIQPYAQFQLAWIYIMRSQALTDLKGRQSLLEKARDSFRSCISLMKDWDYHQPVFDLQQQAALDLAWIFAELRTPAKEVSLYFRELELVPAYHSYLAYLGVDSVRDSTLAVAEAAYADYLPLSKMDRTLPLHLLAQIDYFVAKREFDKVFEGYKRVKMLTDEDSEWRKEWRKDEALIESVRTRLAQHILKTAQAIQGEAEKGDQALKGATGAIDPKKLLIVSRSYYDLHQLWFPNANNQTDLRYNYALLVFQNGEMEKAIQLLTEVANDPSDPYKKDATYSLIVALAELDSSQPKPELPELGRGKQPVPLSKNKEMLIQYIDIYFKNWPEESHNIPSLYTAAQTLYEYAHYEGAMKRFDSLIKLAPQTEQGEAALNTLLSYFVEIQNWDELKAKCKAYLANKAITGAGHRKIIRQTLEYAKSQSPG